MTFTKKHFWIFLSIGFILLYLSPLFSLGQASHVRIHDQLDSNGVWYEILVESGKLFSPNSATIPNMMNGLPSYRLVRNLNVSSGYFLFFTVCCIRIGLHKTCQLADVFRDIQDDDHLPGSRLPPGSKCITRAWFHSTPYRI